MEISIRSQAREQHRAVSIQALRPGGEIAVRISRAFDTPVDHIGQIDIDSAKRVDDPHEGLQIHGHIMIYLCAEIVFEGPCQQTGSLSGSVVIVVARIPIKKCLIKLPLGDAAVICNARDFHVQVTREGQYPDAGLDKVNAHEAHRIRQTDVIGVPAGVAPDQQDEHGARSPTKDGNLGWCRCEGWRRSLRDGRCRGRAGGRSCRGWAERAQRPTTQHT